MPRTQSIIEDVMEDLQSSADAAAGNVGDTDDSSASAPHVLSSIADLLNPNDEGIAIEQVEAPGIGVKLVRDEFTGKTWSIPTGTLADASLAGYKSPRDFPKDPNFHYEVQLVKDLPYYMSQGFVPVTRKELGLDQLTRIGEADALDSYYVIDGEDIAIKIPRELGQRRLDANKFLCDAAIKGVKGGDIRDAQGHRIMPPGNPDARVLQQVEITENVASPNPNDMARAQRELTRDQQGHYTR